MTSEILRGSGTLIDKVTRSLKPSQSVWRTKFSTLLCVFILALEYTCKSLNSSKVRAPGMQNTSHKNSFTLRFESTKNNVLGLAKSGLGTPLPKASNSKTQAKASNSKTQAVALDAKSPKHHLDTSRKRPKPDPKNSFTLPLESTKNNLLGLAKCGLGTPLPKASNSKTQAVALDAKSPKHHLDTSRKRPKPEPKHSFTLPLESTKNNLLGLAKSGLGTPLPKASNSKTQAVALDAKSPKHHLDTSRKRPKPDPKNSFTLPLESTKNNLLGLAKCGLGTPLPKASNSKTQAVALDAKSPKHHLDTSRKRPKPDPKNSFTLPLESTKNNLLGLAKCLALEHRYRKPRTAIAQAVALDAKSPKHHLDTSRKRPKPDPKHSFPLPLESTKNNLLGRTSNAQPRNPCQVLHWNRFRKNSGVGIQKNSF